MIIDASGRRVEGRTEVECSGDLGLLTELEGICHIRQIGIPAEVLAHLSPEITDIIKERGLDENMIGPVIIDETLDYITGSQLLEIEIEGPIELLHHMQVCGGQIMTASNPAPPTRWLPGTEVQDFVHHHLSTT